MMNRGATWFVILFLLAVNAQRIWETFKRRDKVAGQIRMGWSFYAFFALHSLIMVGAFLEFWAFRSKSFAWGWSALGLGLYAGSVILRNVAIRTLGRFWSLHVEIRSQHQLIREGVYNWIRHPAYSAITLEVLSIPLVVNGWWTMLFAVLTYLPVLGLRLRQEERALVEKFGNNYQTYQQKVGMVIPRWKTCWNWLSGHCR